MPTFPNARYVIPGEEWQFWKWESRAGAGAVGLHRRQRAAGGRGRSRLRSLTSEHEIAPGLRFEPTPGHTPGHVAVRLTTPAGQAVFAGDLMHRTVQVAEPQWNSRFCYDGDRARKTREAFVEQHADSGVLILPAHFPRPGYIVRRRRRLPLSAGRLSRIRPRHAAGGRSTAARPRAERPAGTAWPRRRSGATHCTATGNPSGLVPSGSIVAGWPVRLNHTVNGENVKHAPPVLVDVVEHHVDPAELRRHRRQPGREQDVPVGVERGHLTAEPVGGLRGAHVVRGR